MDSPPPLPFCELDLTSLIATVLTTHSIIVADWLINTPGSWGALAGQAVLATRRAVARPLTAGERRIIWQALWDALCRCRADHASHDAR